MDIDRGPIIASESFELPNNTKLPIDYERYNISKGYEFLKKFIQEVDEGEKFQLRKEEIEWDEKEYFPRLQTTKSGWIDWNWSGENIEKFCNSFDSPYPGAQTRLNGKKTLTLKNVTLIKTAGYHPYCSGIIINIRRNKYIEIATNSGILRVRDWKNKEANSVTPRLGDRLITPNEDLESAKYRIRYGVDGPIASD
jgi:hypothetical protein